MTQIIVTLEDNSPISHIRKAISLIRGVSRVIVKKNPDSEINHSSGRIDVTQNIKSLIGIASHISENEIASDERLSYLLSK